jgi:hypothetical protein
MSIIKDFMVIKRTYLLVYVHFQCESNLKDQLKKSRQFLPNSLELDTLLVYCAWKAIKLFDVKLDLIKLFDFTLKYCAHIGNAKIKEGITSMIWHEYICKRVAALTNLIEKVYTLLN